MKTKCKRCGNCGCNKKTALKDILLSWMITALEIFLGVGGIFLIGSIIYKIGTKITNEALIVIYVLAVVSLFGGLIIAIVRHFWYEDKQ